MFEHITASEVAGYGVGTLLLCATISASKIDALISASQRSSLGMCRRCGDLRMVACSRCNGLGSLKDGVSFDFISVKAESKLRSIACTKCRAKGHFNCPECSELNRA